MSDDDDDMKLPAGKSCADCRHFERCLFLIGERWINDRTTTCDWSPSRFVAATAPPARSPARSESPPPSTREAGR